jgi:flagellar motor protein MotB
MPVAVLDTDPMNVAVGPVLDDRDLNLSAQADPTLRTLKMHLDGSLSDNVVEVGLFNQTLTVILPERVLFDSGSAELHPAAFDVLTSLAEAVRDEPVRLEVTGHADGVPVIGGPFGDNWGLSSARSVATTRFLASRGVPVEALTASASITPAMNPEARAVTLRIRADARSPTGGVLDKLYPDG